MISVLLADDHRLVRQGLRLMLERQDDIRVVGEASDGREAIERALELSPDVVLMDLAMPDMDGLAATREISIQVPGCRVLVLTMHDEPQRVTSMLDAGAAGYVVKSAALDELLTAVRNVAAGKGYLQPQVSGALIDALVGRYDGMPAKGVLTERERDVVRAIASGTHVRQVASDLAIAPRTVQTHRQNAMRKLGVHNERELVLYAVREGMVPLPDR